MPASDGPTWVWSRGHGLFALTGHLDELLLPTDGSRVVTVSSMAHHAGEIDLEDLNPERSYQRWEAYGQSKLANLLFSFELQRRLARTATETMAVSRTPTRSGDPCPGRV